MSVVEELGKYRHLYALRLNCGSLRVEVANVLD